MSLHVRIHEYTYCGARRQRFMLTQRIGRYASSARGHATVRACSEHHTTTSRRSAALGLLTIGNGVFNINAKPASALLGTDDGITIVNSVLAAYGLPKLRQLGGFSTYDDIDYSFLYPKGYVGRANTQRPGLVYADYNTSDKIQVEVFDAEIAPPTSPPSESGEDSDASSPPPPVPASELSTEWQRWITSVVNQLISPSAVYSNGPAAGDARLELVPNRKVKVRWIATGRKNRPYVYLIDFPSTTVTRSGYDVRRKNFCCAVPSFEENGKRVYALNASARYDTMDENKERIFRACAASFDVH